MTRVSTSTQPVVVAGVDTHQRTHHVVVLDVHGARLGDREFPATQRGYEHLLDWVAAHGLIGTIGVESTGSYGAGLTRHLILAGIDVVEVNRPDLTTRAREGKSDPIDAEAAARAVLTGRATAKPKITTGVVEAIRVLMITRSSAVKARTAAYSQLRDLITTAPGPLHDTLIAMTPTQRVKKVLTFRPDLTDLNDPAQAAKLALRTLARRITTLSEEITTTEKQLDVLVAQTVPSLLARPQIGTLTAAQLLVTAGENLDRFRNEAAFAKLTGTAPLPASSGKTRRMRLNRGGDRQANRALHLIAVGRLRNHPETRVYAARRSTENLSNRDIVRCLKRAIARETFHALKTDLFST